MLWFFDHRGGRGCVGDDFGRTSALLAGFFGRPAVQSESYGSDGASPSCYLKYFFWFVAVGDGQYPMTLTQDDPVDLPTLKGPMRTYVYRPIAPGKYPGLVLWSEIFNVTEPIRRTAMTMAGHGFIVAVPEVYHEFEPAGTVLAYDQPGADRGNFLKTEKELASYDSDAEAVVNYLENHPLGNGKVGSMGMCLGGHLSMRCAINPKVSAAVCLYATDIHKRSLAKGMNDDTLDRIKEIKAELLMIWGRQDPHVPAEGRVEVYKALAQGECNFQWLELNGAHAFIRDEGYRYDPVLAREAYGLAVEVFKRQLA